MPLCTDLDDGCLEFEESGQLSEQIISLHVKGCHF